MEGTTIYDDLHRLSYRLADEVNALLPQDVRDLVNRACQGVSRRPEERPLDSPVFRIVSLGKQLREPTENEKAQRAKSGQGAIAAAFAAARRPFSIGMRTSRRAAQCDVLIQADGLNGKGVEALLGGIYGSARLEQSGYPEADGMMISRHLICSTAVLNDRELEQTVQQEGNWMARFAGALMGESCSVRLAFAPVTDAWIEEQIAETLRLMDELSGYRRSAMQISVSGNYSHELQVGQLNLPGKVVQGVKTAATGKQEERGYRRTGDSESASRSFEVENHAVARAHELLKRNLTRLDWMRRSGAWSISAWVSATSSTACELATRILNTTFFEAGFRCDEWTPDLSGLDRGRTEQVSAILPVNQLGMFFSFPQEDIPGFCRTPLTEYEINLPAFGDREMSGTIGNIIWHDREMAAPFAIPRDELNRHAFICGMTGSGKTNTVCMLLKNSADRLPFMVIEPVKGEYRTLRASVPNLQVCTMEAGSRDQLCMNPFWFPEGGSLQYHIDSLRAVIASAFELTAAMPNILEQCLTRVYVNLGWNIALGTNAYRDKLREEMLYPTFDMLCSEIDSYLERSNFSDELRSNYKGALSARLRSFTSGTKGMLLNRQVIPPFMEWIDESRSCVIELEALADDADKAIVMGVMLSQYFQCVKSRGGRAADGIRHIIVLEEAHHLFKETGGSVGPGGSEGNVSRRHLLEMLSNMLAEIRAYGEGVFIVDQSPTNISSQVMKNTAVKIVHRVDHGEDLRALQHALLLGEKEMQSPARLKRGEALIRFGSMSRPMHVAIACCEEKENCRLGGAGDGQTEGLVAQRLLDMIQTSDELSLNASDLLLRFLNHLLFDEREGAGAALRIVRERLATMLRRCGVEAEELERLTPGNFLSLIGSCMHNALMKRYPLECHLRGKLQMLADRYLELQLGRTYGVRPVEWEVLRIYCQEEIYPMIAYNYRNGTDQEQQRIAKMFTSDVRCSLTGILANMAKRMNDSAFTGGEDVWKWTADEAVMHLCRGDFLCIPAIAGELWNMFSVYNRT